MINKSLLTPRNVAVILALSMLGSWCVHAAFTRFFVDQRKTPRVSKSAKRGDASDDGTWSETSPLYGAPGDDSD